jgi:hypothetical protein
MFEKICIIAGVPRSGTSWLGMLIDSSPNVVYRFQPFFSYAFKGSVTQETSKIDMKRVFEQLYETEDDFLTQKDKRDSGSYPIFNKSQNTNMLAFKTCRYQYSILNILKNFDNVKLIAIIRNPCGVINSWFKNPKEFPSNAILEHEWRFGACRNMGREEEFFGYYKWKEVANLYLDLRDKFSTQVYIVQYENLVHKTMEEVANIYKFLGIDLVEQTIKFVAESHNKHVDGPYAVFKNKAVVDSWKVELSPSIENEIYDDISNTRLEQFLK